MVLSVQLMDKKYRETIPGLVKTLPFNTSSNDDRANILQSMKKTKSKKGGLKKNGLYAGEDIDLSRWWLNKDVSEVTCDTDDARESCTKDFFMGQKSRETQLQIIIMLEALALESSPDYISDNVVVQQEYSKGEKPRRNKKPQDLKVLLDLHVDRLSIWQTMTLDDTGASKRPKEAASTRADGRINEIVKSNLLHQFCVDVVIPL